MKKSRSAELYPAPVETLARLERVQLAPRAEGRHELVGGLGDCLNSGSPGVGEEFAFMELLSPTVKKPYETIANIGAGGGTRTHTTF